MEETATSSMPPPPPPDAGLAPPVEAAAPAPDAPPVSASEPQVASGGFEPLRTRFPNLEKVLNLELPVIVVLTEKTSTLEEVLSLTEGSVIVFKKHNTEPLDILVHNRRIGAGKTIKVGERFGVLVREIGTARDIIAKIR